MGDVKLTLTTIPVSYKNGQGGTARAEGNNAAWICACQNPIPLVGRCYFQFGHDCHTICPDCNKHYRVLKDKKKKAIEVVEY